MATLLHTICKQGDLKTLQQALKSGNDPSVGDDDGMTPLHYAAWYGNVACVNALLAAGASLDSFDHDGATALHAAAYNGTLNCAVALVEAGANARISDNENLTPRDTAANEGQKEVAVYLRDIEEEQKCDEVLARMERAYNEAKEKSKAAKLSAARAGKEAKRLVLQQEKVQKKLIKTLKLKSKKSRGKLNMDQPMSFSQVTNAPGPPPSSSAPTSREPSVRMRRSSSNNSDGGSIPAPAAVMQPPPSSGGNGASKTKRPSRDVDMVLAQIEADRSDADTLALFLESLDLRDFSRMFTSKNISLNDLRGFKGPDFKAIGLPTSAARKIIAALHS